MCQGCSHHSCGFLFGVLHDDGDLLFDITDELVGDARLGVQNCATNVDAAPEEITCVVSYLCIFVYIFSFFCFVSLFSVLTLECTSNVSLAA